MRSAQYATFASSGKPTLLAAARAAGIARPVASTRIVHPTISLAEFCEKPQNSPGYASFSRRSACAYPTSAWASFSSKKESLPPRLSERTL